MADTPEHPTTIAETQSQFLARAILLTRDLDRVEDVQTPHGQEWTPADEARLQALAAGTGY